MRWIRRVRDGASTVPDRLRGEFLAAAGPTGPWDDRYWNRRLVFSFGGGVGIGRSLHAGQVCVADGTPLARQKLERVLTNDPGMGVIRHVDAGYDEADAVAADRGVRIPMRES